MSNCISVRNSKVVFGPGEVDSAALLKELGKHSGCDREDEHANDDDQWACMEARWFLIPGDNLRMEGDNLVVEFGHGKSTHTWRDFKATCLFMDRFMKGSKSHVFRLCDEDAPTDYFDQVINFTKGGKSL